MLSLSRLCGVGGGGGPDDNQFNPVLVGEVSQFTISRSLYKATDGTRNFIDDKYCSTDSGNHTAHSNIVLRIVSYNSRNNNGQLNIAGPVRL